MPDWDTVFGNTYVVSFKRPRGRKRYTELRTVRMTASEFREYLKTQGFREIRISHTGPIAIDDRFRAAVYKAGLQSKKYGKMLRRLEAEGKR